MIVVCGEAQFEEGHQDSLLNPAVIVEVQSPSTEAYDRGDKFASYQRLASPREYLLIAQDRVSVAHFLRQGEQWLLTGYRDLAATVALPALGCTLAMREVYRRVRCEPTTGG